MSSLTTLARPYAKAAFDLAASGNALNDWHSALALSAVAVDDASMSELLKSPQLDRARAAGLIGETIGADAAFTRFLEVLAENDRLSLLPQVTELFSRLKEHAENQLNVRVVSAIPLDDDQAKRMSSALAKRFECEVDLENVVDAQVLGGAVIYARNEVIDGSLRGRLAKLESTLA